MDEFWQFIINAVLFLLAFKAGQFSMLVKLSQTETKNNNFGKSLHQEKSVITVEEIEGIYYAYDGNDFLGQGKSPHELGDLIARRYPGKYRMSNIKIKAS